MHPHSLSLLVLSWLALLAAASPEPVYEFGEHENGISPFYRNSSSSALPRRHSGRALSHHLESREERPSRWKRTMGPSWTSKASLTTASVKAGIGAMQITVVGTSTVLIIDKAEDNPLQIKGTGEYDKGKTHAAWMQWLNYKTGKYKTLDAQTNSFCAGGTWLSNGTMLSVGGNPRVSASSYYDANGLTGVRMFHKCGDSGCTLFEDADTMRLASARWYPGTVRLADGSAMILGGMTEGGFDNVAATDNPTIEYFPPKVFGKNNGLPVYSKFLHQSLNSNLFPITVLLPGTGYVWVGANERAMVYDWKRNKEYRLSNLPGGLRMTYPWSAASALLPLTIANSWTPTILICGGSTTSDKLKAIKMSSQTAAAKKCYTMTIKKTSSTGWKQISSLPTDRTMGETVLTPDGKVLILNGAQTGLAGYANVRDPVGQSNADNPAYTGVLYDPLTNKISSNYMPTSKIPRMYHSSASLLASGEVIIMGSNPNADVSKVTYKTEYRIEYLSPPYMSSKLRPVMLESWFPTKIEYGASFGLRFSWPGSGSLSASKISVVLMDFGYHTHAIAVDQKLVELNIKKYTAPSTATKKYHQLLVKAPVDGTYYAPGYGWIVVLVNGIPSTALRVMVGDGSAPPSSKSAYHNMMKLTAKSHGDAVYYDKSKTNSIATYSA